MVGNIAMVKCDAFPGAVLAHLIAPTSWSFNMERCHSLLHQDGSSKPSCHNDLSLHFCCPLEVVHFSNGSGLSFTKPMRNVKLKSFLVCRWQTIYKMTVEDFYHHVWWQALLQPPHITLPIDCKKQSKRNREHHDWMWNEDFTKEQCKEAKKMQVVFYQTLIACGVDEVRVSCCFLFIWGQAMADIKICASQQSSQWCHWDHTQRWADDVTCCFSLH